MDASSAVDRGIIEADSRTTVPGTNLSCQEREGAQRFWTAISDGLGILSITLPHSGADCLRATRGPSRPRLPTVLHRRGLSLPVSLPSHRGRTFQACSHAKMTRHLWPMRPSDPGTTNSESGAQPLPMQREPTRYASTLMHSPTSVLCPTPHPRRSRQRYTCDDAPEGSKSSPTQRIARTAVPSPSCSNCERTSLISCPMTTRVVSVPADSQVTDQARCTPS